MKLASRKTVKNLLKKYGTRSLKKFGQNFLIDETVAKKIIKIDNLQPKDIVLEIGPGIGVLTRFLAQKVKKVFAVEKDPKMCEILKETLKDFKNVKIIKKDILKCKLEDIIKKEGILNKQKKKKAFIQKKEKPQIPYKVVANLPFYITAPVIRKFLENENKPEEMILIIQKEVAQRICSRPPKMNILALSVQFYAEPKIVSYISKKSFAPQPKVDAAIIKIIPYKYKKYNVLPSSFFKVVKAGFSHPRKQLVNNLAKKLKLKKTNIYSLFLKNNINPKKRAEALTINDWIKLINMLE